MRIKGPVEVKIKEKNGKTVSLKPGSEELRRHPQAGDALYCASVRIFPFIGDRLEWGIEHMLNLWWGRLLFAAPFFAASYILFRHFDIVPNKWLSLGVVGGLIVVFGLDVYTTVLRHKREGMYQKNGWEFPAPEANPYMSQSPTVREMIFSWATVLTLLIIVASFIWPSIGIPVIVLRLLAVVLNYRDHQRLEWVARYAEGRL